MSSCLQGQLESRNDGWVVGVEECDPTLTLPEETVSPPWKPQALKAGLSHLVHADQVYAK